jgi:pimeloyl-ACP methyl ester carboxylesterase
MAIIYCIPGTGLDGRLFSRLDLPGHELRYVSWVLPHKREKLGDYALRLASQIDTAVPFVLIGVSFGGMICAELARILSPERVFLIASSKHRGELPLKIRFLKAVPFYRLLHDRAYVFSATLSRRMFGYKGRADGKLFREMLGTAPEGYFRRAADCMVGWDAQSAEPGIIHIHGTRDRVLPLRNIKADYIIQGGSHNLLQDHAAEISMIILNELNADS